MKGKVKFFNVMKGFGFISAENGTECFVHQSALKPGLVLKENDEITFDIEQGDRGARAVNVSKGAAEEKEATEEEEAAE